MNQDDVNRLIKAAGPLVRTPFDQWCAIFAGLVENETFAKQKARWYSEGHEDGMRLGIELAAKSCEARIMGDLNREDQEAQRCADDIRARGKK